MHELIILKQMIIHALTVGVIMSKKFSLGLILMIVHFLSFELCAQNSWNTIPNVQQMSDPAERIVNPVTESAWEPTTSLFLELLGKGWYSVNIDFRKKETSAVSIGIQVVEEVWPSVMYYRFFGKRHRLETGGGISGIITMDGFAGMAVHGTIGYRYQKKEGLLFRAGFTPIVGIPFNEEGKFAFVPFPGVSLGYSF
jgi:hypothetical protein